MRMARRKPRLAFDQGPGHDVASVARLGSAGIQDGLLLKKAAETGFEMLVTMDSNIAYQQNLVGHHIKVIVLRARSNRLADASPLMAKVLETLPHVQNGTLNLIE
jgi:hypothetical protein